VVLSILYFLNKVFEPYRLKVIGQLIALGAFYGLLIQPLVKVYKFFKVPGRLGKVKRWRMYSTIALLAVVAAAIWLVPLPSHVYAPLEVQARDAASVYIGVDGILEKTFVRPGDRVAEGQLLAQLRNIDLDLSIADLAGQRDVYEAQLAGLTRMSFVDRAVSGQSSSVLQMLASVKQQLAQREAEKQMLRLVAPKAGTVLPPPKLEEQPDADSHLPTWSGSPFDRDNVGATLVQGTKLCQIGDPDRLEARLVIDQNDIEFVAPSQRVEVMLAQSAEFVYVSKVERVSTEDLKVSPSHLSSLHGGDLPTQMSPGGVARPLSPAFEAVVPLPDDDPHGLMRIGLVGQAKIHTAPRTLWDRLVRYVKRTFNFEL
jgi:putative peptide zinc metalloprotease protein